MVDLSAVTFLSDGWPSGSNPPWGQYGDGVVYSNIGYPDFICNDALGSPILLDPTKTYTVAWEYDPSSLHDDGGRRLVVSPLRPGSLAADYDNDLHTSAYYGRLLYSTAPVREGRLTMGPGQRYWDSYVPNGFTAFYVSSHYLGALKSLTIVATGAADTSNPVPRRRFFHVIHRRA